MAHAKIPAKAWGSLIERRAPESRLGPSRPISRLRTFVPRLPYDGSQMATWSEIAQSKPDLVFAGERLLFGDLGTAFLATVRADGGPRLHPVAPVLAAGRLYLFVVNMSPKHADLLRDARYALHALPPPGGGEEFYITGRSKPHKEPDLRRQVSAASGNRLGNHDFEDLFELDISRVLHTRWSGWGTKDIWPHYTRWPGIQQQATINKGQGSENAPRSA
jgi:hypothetical protein